MICFINQFENCHVTLQASDTQELMEALGKSAAPDLILLELNGFKTLEWLGEAYPDIPVIILTRFDTTLTSDRLIYLGARSVLEKNTDEKELKKAILRVSEDGYYYNTPALRKMSVFLNKEENKKQKSKLFFTEREWKFLQLVPTEMTHDQIADEMKISSRVVNKINSELFEKLNIKNRATLAMRVVSHGLFHAAA